MRRQQPPRLYQRDSSHPPSEREPSARGRCPCPSDMSTVKYHAWGDGFQCSRLVEREDGFTVWYWNDGAAVGVLTCNADDDYELGRTLIEQGKPAPVGLS